MNYFRNLLSGCLLLTSMTMFAFPTVTITPNEGTLTNKQQFASINLTIDGSYTISSDATAKLESQESGDEFTATTFKDFMGIVLIKFNETDIYENGDYVLTIPAGSIISDGESNPTLSFNYTLNDPNLNSTQYPQITLLSSNPADGAKLAEFGGSSLNKVTFKTSDDDAVNYIAWFLYDVTDPENPEYVRQGNENRIDLNRNGNTDDSWADGLYVNIGGSAEKLVAGHKYEMSLTFAGIGYNPDTNQYPTPQQIAASTELETAIYFEGLSDAPEYSPYVYESVSPDPSTYEIETVEGARFTITYSGPVKPTVFNYTQATATVITAGSWEALGEPDEDGYSNMWEFTFYPEVVKNLIGTTYVTIQTKDKDGLYVKGNGDYLYDNYNYGMSWVCNIGAPDLTLISPQEGTTLESLDEIIVGNSENMTMAISYNGGAARIVDLQGAEIRILDYAVAVDGANQMKWTFEPITESGSYVLIVPAYYFALGEEYDGASSKQTTFRFTVENSSTSDGAAFDLIPISVTPADNSTVTEIPSVVLTFADITFYPMSIGTPEGKLYLGDKEIAAAPAEENDWWYPTEYTFTFAIPATEAGTYTFVVPKGGFCDEDYDMNDGTKGHACPELVYTFIIAADEDGIADIIANDGTITVYTVSGVKVLENAPASSFNTLEKGLYIINGTKVLKP